MHGICLFNLVPVRTDASHKSELCTQLLFGDFYHILETSLDGNWLKIKIIFDEYEGFIDAKQHTSISSELFAQALVKPMAINYDDIAYLDGNAHAQLIVLGSSLPFLQGRSMHISDQTLTFQGELMETPENIHSELISFFALRFMHTPYLWGGKSQFGIDCSGFTQMVYKLLGYQIKRDAYQQATMGILVSLKEARVGDLAFFDNEIGKITHVGLILEDNKIIHAHGQVRIDLVDEKGILNLASKKYSHKLSSLRRIIV